jgi:tRNA A37 threonylcarbamoyladenosine dehydratase
MNPSHLHPIQEMTEAELETYRLHRRFDRMGRLVGDRSMKKLMDSHVMILGMGGVGSWAAESIARSGVGQITLVDFDEICITNANRQLHALAGLVGKYKTEVMAERIQKINPAAKVNACTKFYCKKNSDEILDLKPDFVIDAIDNITAKCHLIATCKQRGIPMIVATGSAGRMDPLCIQVKDLSETEKDPLARNVRRILREQYGFPDKGKFGILAVYSTEDISEPFDLYYDGGKGFRCVCPQGKDNPHSCEHRSIILGSASFVTGSFGLVCASQAVQELIKKI